MRPTIDEIAKKAGVSPGTVSRVLNRRNKENRPAIAARSARIRQLAAEMGYRPNAAARSISRGRFGVVAFVTCGDTDFDWFSRRLLGGLHHRLESRGESLLVNQVRSQDFADPAFVPRLFQESAIDGLVLHHDPKLDDHVVKYFESQPVPGVLVNRKSPTRCVYPDERGGGYAATRHLLRRGCKKIGFFRLTCDEGHEPHYSVADRHQGCLNALREAQLPAGRCQLGDPHYRQGQEANGVERAQAFLNKHADLDGVVCYQMTDAAALYGAAMRRGLSVPDDLRLAVFSEHLANVTTGLPIDTVRIPFDKVGIAAIDMLHTMIDAPPAHPALPTSVQVPYETIFDAALLDELAA